MKKFYLSFIAMLMTVIGMQAATSDVLYIVGNKMPAKWQWNDQSAMTKVSEGVFTYTGQFAATTGKDGFQFMTSAAWGNVNRMVPVNGIQTISTGTYDLAASTAATKDDVFNLDTAGDYKITVDQNTMKLTVEAAQAPVETVENLYLIGKATTAGWSLSASKAVKMTKSSDNVFTWTGELTNPSNSGQEGEFLFISETNESGSWGAVTAYVGENKPTPVVSGGEYTIVKKAADKTGDTYFKVPSTDTYTVTADMNTMKMKIEKSDSPVKPDYKLYILGTINNFSANGALNYPLEKDITGVYKWTGKISGWFNIVTGPNQYPRYGTSTGDNETVVVNKKYALTYYATNPGSDAKIGWRILTEGDYTICMDMEANELWVEAVASGVDDVIADGEAPAEYYNMQGVRVENPANGLYIKKQGGKAEKVIVK